ncbi:hypothetical protein [Nonomuraea salmonea]|uniref:hypothetical protein n=1 Tax=Nonomuraea salmonea TaxID=46181 RepID=UPI003CD06C34
MDSADETVRFAQRHQGVPVFGAHYLVHFRKDGDRREVVGAGGPVPHRADRLHHPPPSPGRPPRGSPTPP